MVSTVNDTILHVARSVMLGLPQFKANFGLYLFHVEESDDFVFICLARFRQTLGNRVTVASLSGFLEFLVS